MRSGNIFQNYWNYFDFEKESVQVLSCGSCNSAIWTLLIFIRLSQSNFKKFALTKWKAVFLNFFYCRFWLNYMKVFISALISKKFLQILVYKSIERAKLEIKLFNTLQHKSLYIMKVPAKTIKKCKPRLWPGFLETGFWEWSF